MQHSRGFLCNIFPPSLNPLFWPFNPVILRTMGTISLPMKWTGELATSVTKCMRLSEGAGGLPQESVTISSADPIWVGYGDKDVTHPSQFYCPVLVVLISAQIIAKSRMADYDRDKAQPLFPIEEEVGYTLKRQLKPRHIGMIRSLPWKWKRLKNGGPLGLLLGYVIVGTICYSDDALPSARWFRTSRFLVDISSWQSASLTRPSHSQWAGIIGTLAQCAAVLIDYWEHHKVSDAAWVSVCLVVVIFINLLGAGAYGEAEFFFVSFKVVTIVGLLILGVILDLGGGPNHDRIGFRYWKHPGPFVQFNGIGGTKGRFLGWWSVMTQAAFSYIGTEIVGIASGEAKNPRRNLPKAIKRIYIRILLFYIGGAWTIAWLVPSNDKHLGLTSDAASSPFVIAISRAGIRGLPSVINAAIMTSAWSSASSSLFTSSRALYGLAISGNAPKTFARTSKAGLPYVSVTFCALFCSLAYMGVRAGPGKVFGWFANMTSIAGLMTWFGIAFTYVRFYNGLKTQGYTRSKLPFYSRLQPYAAWVFLSGGWNRADFITNYLPLVLFPILYFGARNYLYKIPMVDALDMDFNTGTTRDSQDEPPPENAWESDASPGFSCVIWCWGYGPKERLEWGGYVNLRPGSALLEEGPPELKWLACVPVALKFLLDLKLSGNGEVDIQNPKTSLWEHGSSHWARHARTCGWWWDRQANHKARAREDMKTPNY
ncbi:hypothetical protein BS47DRAFT_1362220 [Hydnum rufescens UP504]|uniref:Amino acid permease/ SLC12A domain-containing protein n=1 Tax=Hydnum rufescens UP504 TaxID=1448309 RepID=A0A9P6DTW6_9AGAM|nr:hypothetical protein BS47DRAFT_1362220 [Hydnum rufescens UP504]